MAALSLLQEGLQGCFRDWSQGQRLRGQGREPVWDRQVPLPQGRVARGALSLCDGAAPGVQRLLAFPPSSPSLGPARVVNVLIAALMSCKWDPTSRYIRVMSSHLTNGDLIELLIGCLFPPRFMTPRPGLSGEGEVRQCQRLARRPFQGHRLSTFLQRKINSLRLLCLLLNISFKLHTLAPCPNAPRKHPQSSSAAGWSEQPPEARAPAPLAAAHGVPRARRAGRCDGPAARATGTAGSSGGMVAPGQPAAATWQPGGWAAPGSTCARAGPGHRAG